MATGGDLYACIEVLVNKHPEEGWCKRAIRDLQAYIRGAKDGVLPGLIASACEKCFKQAIPGVRFGGSHHVMCKRSGKPRQIDATIMAPILKLLRETAEVRLPQLAFPCPRRVPCLSSIPNRRLFSERIATVSDGSCHPFT